MSLLTMEINRCSVTLYEGTAAIGAHAGSSISIEKWIGERLSEFGKIPVSGYHRLIALRSRENNTAAESQGSPANIRLTAAGM